jgi:hypothetical protein
MGILEAGILLTTLIFIYTFFPKNKWQIHKKRLYLHYAKPTQNLG